MIGVELRKQTLRIRTAISLGFMALIPIIFTIAIKANPPHDGHGEGFFRLATQSGINLPLAVLTAVSEFLLVVVACLYAGDTVAGEAAWGTLRYLLVRPVGRTRLLWTKLVVAALFALVATLIVALFALIAGTIAFGWHPVVIPPKGGGFFPQLGNLPTLSQGAAIARLALSVLYVGWGMVSFVAFAFFLSCLTDSPAGAIAGGVGLGILSQILDNINALGVIRYGLPTHYLDGWHGLFVAPTETGDMVRGVIVQAVYLVVFGSLAWWWFRRKDITS